MYTIPILDLKAQYRTIKKPINKTVKKVLAEQNFILGEEVDKLEKEIAVYCGTRYAVGVASGTDAIQLALKAVGIGPGDEVITVTFTFIATAEAISNVGATPKFVDIDLKTYNMDPAPIERAITDRTKAVMPVHLYGQCADMDEIVKIARRRGVKVIEDCAQAIGSSRNGKMAGSFGLAGCLSFFPSKNLGGYGDGGMVVTDDKEIYEKVRLLRVHGSASRYKHSILGYNSRLDNLQAAILRVKLQYLDSWAQARRENADYYNRMLSKIANVTTPFLGPYNVHVYHQYTIMVDGAVRDKLIEFLENHGVEARAYYPIPLHLQECYKGLGYKTGDFPNSEKASLGALSIPAYPELKKSEKRFVVKKIEEFFKKL